MEPAGPLAPYVGEASAAYHLEKRAVPAAALPWIVRTRAELFQHRVRPTDAVLEWGCGFGWNLAGLTCARRVGHDVAEALQSAVEGSGMEFLRHPETVPSGQFDVVLCHHALEHVPDPYRVLGEIRRLLRPQGVLLLAVPFETQRRYRRFDPAEPNHHLYSWNVQTLGNLLRASAYRVDDLGLRAYGYDRRAALLAMRLRLGERGFRTLRAVLRRLRPIQEIAAVASPG